MPDTSRGMPPHDGLADFVLYGQESYSNILASQPRHTDDYMHHGLPISLEDSFSQIPMNSYDAFTSTQAFPNLPHALLKGPEYFYDTQPETMRQYKPQVTGSPATSAIFSLEHPSALSSASGASVPSAASSAIGSPHMLPGVEAWPDNRAFGMGTGIVHNDSFIQDSSSFMATSLDQEAIYAPIYDKPGFVDTSVLQPFQTPTPHASMPHQPEIPTFNQSPHAAIFNAASPALSHISVQSQRRPGSDRIKDRSQSPYLHAQYQPYPYPASRRPSIASNRHSSQGSPGSGTLDEDESNKGRCPNPECGKIFKDLKAHMLTHQAERPEKCPIVTCEYHQKGFARKYDKNRHTLTHYKGTMVCGFCPGSGSAAEKSFNRADVFKRHLTSVHGVEQSPPNSRKKASGSNRTGSESSEASGKCSTCSQTFSNAQEFYEHLDDCVLRVVQQIDPSEATNERNLATVENDEAVHKTLEKNSVPNIGYSMQTEKSFDEDEEGDEDEDDNDNSNDEAYPGRPHPTKRSSGGSTNKSSKGRPGLTHSKGGVPLVAYKGRKRRKNFPPSWGSPIEKMKMKKRVLCVYDGPRRLWKDDMMLDNEFEVRLRLGGEDSNAYVTDLDVQTLKRAEGVLGATDEERGPWIPDINIGDVDLSSLMG